MLRETPGESRPGLVDENSERCTRSWLRLGLLWIAALLSGSTLAQAQIAPGAALTSGWDPAAAFLRPYGIENFTPFYQRVLRAWLRASMEYEGLGYAGAQRTLDTLWLRHPVGGVGYGNQATQPFGINIGSPPCYYGLRMLTDVVDWRMDSGVQGSAAPRSVLMTVVLVGHSNGVEPRDLNELNQGTGIQVQHALDERLLQNDNRVVHQSLALFSEYVLAMTSGKLSLEIQILHLPEADLKVEAHVSQGRFVAGLENAADLWAHVSADVLERTDWWWLLYPSHVPEQYPDFQNAEFVTGGMGAGGNGLSPLFIVDDRWLVRKPPHIGSGLYSDLERMAYLPQWLQHEFFHHLFRTYPEFGLEQTPHQWFSPGAWPADFEGRYEADYFHEALYKRLQLADPPLHVGLRYATAGAPWASVQLADVMGEYRREPVQNDWHIGRIEAQGSGLRWTNNAGVSWLLAPDLAAGDLLTGPDCPYYDPPSGTKFEIVLARDDLGDLTDEVIGFAFNGDLYALQTP